MHYYIEICKDQKQHPNYEASAFMTRSGFNVVAGHPYLFINWKTLKSPIVAAVFVNYLRVIASGNDLNQIENFKQSVTIQFVHIDEGKLEYYLGGKLRTAIQKSKHLSLESARLYPETPGAFWDVCVQSKSSH